MSSEHAVREQLTCLAPSMLSKQAKKKTRRRRTKTKNGAIGPNQASCVARFLDFVMPVASPRVCPNVSTLLSSFGYEDICA